MIDRLTRISRRLLLRVLAAPIWYVTAEELQPTYTRKQLREKIRSARTPEDHRSLAVYFRTQENILRKREAEQLRLLQEYLDQYSNHPAKYPTRGDTARHLATQYALQGQQAADRAAEQERLAR